MRFDTADQQVNGGVASQGTASPTHFVNTAEEPSALSKDRLRELWDQRQIQGFVKQGGKG